MNGTVVEIHPYKRGQRYDAQWKRYKFRLLDGQIAFTDLCAGFRNFSKWERLRLRAGDIISGLELMPTKPGKALKINADTSRPGLHYRPPAQEALL